MITFIPNNFGLSNRDMASIFTILRNYSEVRTVLIFGSRAKGSFKSGSDIDLAIMDENVSEETLIRIQSSFKESSLPYFVDILNFQALQHTDLKDHITRVGVPFYERK